jgi:hypothetical protein
VRKEAQDIKIKNNHNERFFGMEFRQRIYFVRAKTG